MRAKQLKPFEGKSDLFAWREQPPYRVPVRILEVRAQHVLASVPIPSDRLSLKYKVPHREETHPVPFACYGSLFRGPRMTALKKRYRWETKKHINWISMVLPSKSILSTWEDFLRQRHQEYEDFIRERKLDPEYHDFTADLICHYPRERKRFQEEHLENLRRKQTYLPWDGWPLGSPEGTL